MTNNLTNSLEKKIELVVKGINRVNPFFIVLVILYVNYLSFTLDSNEEQYFQIAKHFVNPNWVAGSVSLDDFAGHKIIYQYIVGNILNYLSFESTAFILKLISYALFSIPLSKIFRKLSLSNAEIILIFEILYLPSQTFFAGEFIFKGFEPKTLAYLFLFYSLFEFLENRYSRSYNYLILSTYMHILVGGWFFLALSLTIIIFERDWKLVLRNSIKYGLALSPMLIYLASNIAVGKAKVINGVNLDWIYTYFRAPHHTAIFNTLSSFYQQHFTGVLLTLLCLVLILMIRNSLNDKILLKISNLLIIIFSIILFFLVVAYFDRTGVILKYHTFRISAVSKFLMVVAGIMWLKSFLDVKHIVTINAAIGVILIPLFLKDSIDSIYWRFWWPASHEVSANKMQQYIINNTSKDDVFLYIDANSTNDRFITWTRDTERERFSIFKFVPTGTERLYNWYVRYMEKEKLRKNITYINELKNKYRIDYIVSNKPLHDPRLVEIYRYGQILYKVQKNLINSNELISRRPIYRNGYFFSIVSNGFVSYEPEHRLNAGKYQIGFEYTSSKFHGSYAQGVFKIIDKVSGEVLISSPFEAEKGWQTLNEVIRLNHPTALQFQIHFLNDARDKDEDLNLSIRNFGWSIR